MSHSHRPTRRLLAADRRRSGGFTLLELLIVTGLLTLITAVSWPSIRRSMSRASHDRAVDEVIELLADARSRSIAEGRPHLVQLDPMGRRLETYEVAFDEVGASYFLADQLKTAASTAPATPPLETATADLPDATRQGDEMDRPEDPGDDRRRSLPAGVGWRRGTTLELPDGVWCRLAEEREPRVSAATVQARLQDASVSTAEPFPREMPADLRSPEPATLPGQAAATSYEPLRLLFGVEGRTADIELQVCNVSGLCTMVSLDGALGVIRKGETRREKTTKPDTHEDSRMRGALAP